MSKRTSRKAVQDVAEKILRSNIHSRVVKALTSIVKEAASLTGSIGEREEVEITLVVVGMVGEECKLFCEEMSRDLEHNKRFSED